MYIGEETLLSSKKALEEYYSFFFFGLPEMNRTININTVWILFSSDEVP